jgi:hypothetical protein
MTDLASPPSGAGLSSSTAPEVAALRASIPDEIRERIESVIAWCRYQSMCAMDISAGASITHGDDSGALQMLNSMASDVDINLSMLEDYLGTRGVQP